MKFFKKKIFKKIKILLIILITLFLNNNFLQIKKYFINKIFYNKIIKFKNNYLNNIQYLGKSNFIEKNYKKNYKKNYIKYYPLDKYGRATGAEAILSYNMINTGTIANKKILPIGFIIGKYNYARGHLIGKQLGGSGDDIRNLITIYQNPVNTPFMTKYENKIRSSLNQKNIIKYKVKPIYIKNRLICKKILLEAKSLNNKSLNFSVIILNEEN